MMYFCLCMITVVLRPPKTSGPSTRSKDVLAITATTAVIFIFTAGPLFLRNFAFEENSSDRTVYAYSNFDVSPASFWVQVLNFLVFSFLLASIWNQWSKYYCERVRKIESTRFNSALESAFDADNLATLSTEILRWQICLVFLSAGFMIYTAIFWKQIISNGDLRFLIEAFFTHALWLISAVIMAMPFWATWRAWRFNRVRALGELVQGPQSKSDDLETKLSALRELRPVGSWNVTTIVATILSSLLPPMIQLIFKIFETA